MSQLNIDLGLCCIVDELRKCKVIKDGKLKNTEIFCSRTFNSKNKFDLDKAKEKAIQNIKDLLTLLEYCVQKKIKCFRISSDLFPFIVDDDYSMRYSIDFAKDLLKEVGDYARKNGIYLLMHPCQLVNLGTPHENVFQLSLAILTHHVDLLEALGTDKSSILIVHGGGSYGDLENTKKVWIQRFHQLPQRIKDRLTIENCERQYNVRDCLQIATECKIPVVFDTHHYECYNQIYQDKFKETPENFLQEVVATWGSNIPVFHVSSQKADARIGAHSDYITEIPTYLIDFVKTNNIKLRLEVEAKAKEKALFALGEKYEL